MTNTGHSNDMPAVDAPAVDLNATARLYATVLNRMLDLPDPSPGTRANCWFGGYGCRWCASSRAWFTVVPHEQADVAQLAATLFREAGAIVKIHPEAGGAGLQVSAYA